MNKYNGLEVKVRLVRENKNSNYPVINSPEDAFNLVKELGKEDREYFVMACLNTSNQVIGISTIAIGSLYSAPVHPREVFKAAILANSHTLILFHNHPTGTLDVSPEDIVTTEKLKKAGNLLGIQIIDHLVIAGNKFMSFKNKRLI